MYFSQKRTKLLIHTYFKGFTPNKNNNPYYTYSGRTVRFYFLNRQNPDAELPEILFRIKQVKIYSISSFKNFKLLPGEESSAYKKKNNHP